MLNQKAVKTNENECKLTAAVLKFNMPLIMLH